MDAFTQTSFCDTKFVCLVKSQACDHTNDALAVLIFDGGWLDHNEVFVVVEWAAVTEHFDLSCTCVVDNHCPIVLHSGIVYGLSFYQ